MSHKFKIKQMVRLKQPGSADARMGSADVYEIVRLMPADQSGELSYRIRSGSLERAVRESEIRNA
ncbi:hypothetical protein [Microvirga makkahensis]|uniref:Uncharacterized protein n=1 Tax=Microvirga makkahensis TaxID=1128670 RepID=A0A7X3MSW5_9HYPH|nr:hypothetical protein [Microvirga makkahensis]MXQ12624.1 hypothetical protein [Microvirga makkahensis]